LALALPLAAIYATDWRALRAAPPAGKPAPFAYVTATRPNMGPAIKRFYDYQGGLDIFGLPLPQPVQQDGMPVQDFQRPPRSPRPILPPPAAARHPPAGRPPGPPLRPPPRRYPAKRAGILPGHRPHARGRVRRILARQRPDSSVRLPDLRRVPRSQSD